MTRRITRASVAFFALALLTAPLAAQTRARRDVHGIHAGMPEVDGDYAPALVERVVRRRLADLAACRDAAMRRRPALDGSLAVRFRLTADGNVTTASIQSNETADVDLAPCVLSAVTHWQFAAPHTGDVVEITLPFAFRGAEVPRIRTP